jgi:antimicrobial peptide system SdpB family protein
MFKELNENLKEKITGFNPWTNAYGLARSLIGLATLLTLLFNDSSILFKPAAGLEEYPFCKNNLSIFCLVPNDYQYLEIIRWVCIAILVLVVIGWRPRFTGIPHYWIMYSLQNSATVIDGGEQIGTVITLLLVPITLCDHRRWHWTIITDKDESFLSIYKVVTIYCFWIAIRIQMAIVYANAALERLKNVEWADGTAIYYFFNDPMFGIPDYLAVLLDPILNSPIVVILTWGTTILELFLFSALISPKKYWNIFLWSGIFLHTSIALLLGLYSFSLIMIGCLLLFLHPLDQTIKLLNKNKFRNKKSVEVIPSEV